MSLQRLDIAPLLGVLFLAALAAVPAAANAQTPSAQAPIAAEGGVGVTSQYIFRGVRQTATGVAVSPFAGVAITPYEGGEFLNRIVVNAGFWNSLNSGDTGAGGPAGTAWYESRVYGSMTLRFAGDVSVGTSFTAYTSPNEMFTTIKEFGIRLEHDRRGADRFSVNSYAATAFELGAEPGSGQLDGGRTGGTYLELGLAPSYRARFMRIEVPVKIGLSLRDYYELAGQDRTFGLASIGANFAVPIGATSALGRWTVRAGIEVQRYGEATKVFNGGDTSAVIGSLSIGLAY